MLGPVSTIFMGYAFLSEPITWMQISGMTLVIAAMSLLVRNNPNKKSQDSKKSNVIDDVEPIN
jgi:drug/metabolite transporter (DMT)-like permease